MFTCYPSISIYVSLYILFYVLWVTGARIICDYTVNHATLACTRNLDKIAIHMYSTSLVLDKHKGLVRVGVLAVSTKDHV